jgi:hypothetical protein
MAKKKNNTILLGAVAVVGVGVLYWRGAFDKLISQFKKEDVKEDITETETPPKVVAPTQQEVKKVVNTKPVGPSPQYVSKIKNLQLFLGKSATGLPDESTNIALAKKFPTLYASLGKLSITNIDKYIDAKDNVGKVTRGQQVWNAMGGGKPSKIVKTAKYSALYYDASSKLWKPTGGSFWIKAGTNVYKSTSQLSTDGVIVAKNVPTFTTDKLDLSAGVKNLRIDPNNLYV